MRISTTRPRAKPVIWWSLVCVYVLLIFILSTRPHLHSPIRFPMWDKVAHLAEYLSLGFLSQRAAAASWPGYGWRRTLRVGALLVCGIAIAAGDETLQSFVPGRESSRTDFAVDALGLVIGLILDRLIGRRRSGKTGEAT
jgi:VanZ family protein